MSIPDTDNPIALFQEWLEAARATGQFKEPTAMTLATADASGMPNARMVLLKECDARGFVFYTNLGSQKARELDENPRAALCFHWMPMERQVRISGSVEKVSDAEADAYFASRPRQAQIGAWASKQSQPLEGRYDLERRVAAYAAKFGLGTVPRPAFWSGYRVLPQRIEFWQGMPFRLHDRVLFVREGDGWTRTRLFP